MTNEQKFAIAMSVLLFDMRSEDLNNNLLFDDDGNQIPVDYIDAILDKPKHQEVMKEKIRMSVLEHVTRCPNQYNQDDQGEFHYTAPHTYDHAYVMDEYIQDRYRDTQKQTIYQCQHCMSDNVQVKAWVEPNNNNAYVDEVEGDELGWCGDCEHNVVVETIEVSRSNHVIGFQVVGADNSPYEGEMHPDMDGSFCVYNLKQAKEMIDDDLNWELLTIWDDTIEEPTMMFKGQPRS